MEKRRGLSKCKAFIKKHKFAIALIIALPVILFPLFYRLDAHPIFLWDEARQAINMQEMLENGNIFVTYFEGSPDHYNTKPPLLIWLQASIMLISDNPELSLRLPSAFAGLGIILLIIWFFKIFLNQPMWGIFSAFVLVSTSGFIELHGTRTGDYDALITLWITWAAIQYFLFTEKGNSKNLYLFYLFFGLGIATKASVPFMILPILFIWTWATGNLKNVLTTKGFYIGLIIPIAFILLFFGIRSYLDDGYLEATWTNDFGGRFNTSIDGHSEPFNYYWSKLITERARYFLLLTPISLVVILLKNRKATHFSLFCLLFIALFLFTISLAKTKIYWYDTPLLPFISIAIAFAVFGIFTLVLNKINLSVGVIVLAISTFLIYKYPYRHNANKVINNSNYSWEGDEFYEPSRLIKKAINNEVNLKNTTLLFDHFYYPHYQFYINRLQTSRGYLIKHKQYANEITIGDKLIYFQPFAYQDSLEQFFNFEKDSISANLSIIKIKGKVE